MPTYIFTAGPIDLRVDAPSIHGATRVALTEWRMFERTGRESDLTLIATNDDRLPEFNPAKYVLERARLTSRTCFA